MRAGSREGSKWQRRMHRLSSWKLPEMNYSLLWSEVELAFLIQFEAGLLLLGCPRDSVFHRLASSLFFICHADSSAAVCPETIKGRVPVDHFLRQPLNKLSWQHLHGRPFAGLQDSLTIE